MVVFALQSDDRGRQNFLGYDKYILIGFDYSWKTKGSYYSFDKEAGGKRNYMRHALGWDKKGELCYTSSNLMFSAKWLVDYVNAFGLPVVQCSSEGITGMRLSGDLEDQLKYSFKPENGPVLKNYFLEINKLKSNLKELKTNYVKLISEHENNMYLTV